MRVTKRMPSLTGVAPGSTAVLNLPIGPTYEQVKLDYSGMTLRQMKNIQILANGKPFQRFKDAVEVDMLNKYYGRPAANGFLTFWFVQPEMKTASDERLTALGTADLNTLTIQFDIAAGAANPVVKAHSLQSESQPFGLCTKVLRFPNSIGSAGTDEIDNLTTSGARIKAIHFVKNDVSHTEIEVDQFIAYQASKELSIQNQGDYGRVPQNGVTHADFVLEGDMAQAIVTEWVENGKTVRVQDLRIRNEIGSPGTMDVIVELYDGLGGL